MLRTFALHQGSFGRAAILKLKSGLLPHAHPDAQLVCWLGGSPIETLVGSAVLRHDQGEITAINPFEPHRVRILGSGSESLFLTICIDPAWMNKRGHCGKHSKLFATPSIPADDSLRLRARNVLELILGSSANAVGAVDLEVEGFIDGAIEASRRTRLPRVGIQSSPCWLDYRLRRAISFMHQNVGARAKITEMAGRCGLSRPHFYALFREQLSTTPQLYWDTLRLEEAVRRLVRDDAPVRSIAHDLGFTTPNNFARYFRQHTGVPPVAYRRAVA